MSRYFRALALDYDGTLTDGPTPDDAVLAALADARRAGWCLVLVTGRCWPPLKAVFPTLERCFDAVVAENGAVLWTPALGLRSVAQPVPAELDPPLAARGVPFVRGDVLLGTEAVHDQTVLHEVARLGLEVQLVRNRHALMVLPPGVSKGTGLLEALRDLGVSPHSTVAVGDAENDHSLLETCEIGVAVANAVPSLQAHADVVLAQAAGLGIVGLVNGPLLRGEIRVQPKRWLARLGTLVDGGPATIPGSQVNLLIAGGSRSGKSCLAGLLAERLAAMGYAICVVDPEGDHVGLEALRGFTVAGGEDPLPDDQHLGKLLRTGSVIVDLSLASQQERPGRCRHVLSTLAGLRERSGLPHWIVMDEAHLVPDVAALLSLGSEPSAAGVCLATYRPELLGSDTLRAMDLAITLPGEGAGVIGTCLSEAGFLCGDLEKEGSALLIDRGLARRFTVDQRASAHIRHWHKYRSGELPFHRRFFFRGPERPTGAVAGSIGEFHDEIARAGEAVLHHHAGNRDFSRWIDGVIGDRDLAERMRELEARVGTGSEEVEESRRNFLEAIEARYSAG